MELKSFSNQAISAVGQQALHHIFLAENFRKNLDEVINFECSQDLFFRNFIDIWYYLIGLSEDNLYAPIVCENVERYIHYYWLKNRVLPLDQYYLTDKILQGNREIFPEDFPSFSIWEEKASFESLRRRKLAAFFGSHKKVMQEVLRFYVSMFRITTSIVSDEKKDFDSLVCKDEFLAYCNYLLHHMSPLLMERDYVLKVKDILLANTDFTFQDATHVISGTFFDENVRVLKRINDSELVKEIIYR